MADVAPHAPAIIRRLLDTLGIALCEVPEQPGLAPGQRVQAALLEDQRGTVLVLFSRDQLLDLQHLRELTGRGLLPLRHDHLQRMLDKQQIGCMPGLPPLTRAPCLYDTRLLQQPSLLVESGQPGVLLSISNADFRRLLGRARCARFAVPLSDVALNLEHPDQDFAQIRTAVDRAGDSHTGQRLDTALQVPPLSPCAQKIIKLRLDPDATVDDISKLVESDPALAELLLLCTAVAPFSAAGKARSAEDAMVRVLGFELGSHLALGLAVDKTLRQAGKSTQPANAYLPRMLHSATIMRLLCNAMPLAQRPEIGLASLCGLLHDIGFELLEQAFAQQLPTLRQHFEINPHAPHSYIEQQLLGITREQLGSWLMRHWDLPEELASALRFQNDPGYSGAHAQYANLLCLTQHLIATGYSSTKPASALAQALFVRLGIDWQQAGQAIATLPDTARVSGPSEPVPA
jgi:HD-like signal output (HDOD) protein/prolyl-tRNA editing enzyme YbaK/EbsC (Cys-tRNA(Pro) deacylase)